MRSTAARPALVPFRPGPPAPPPLSWHGLEELRPLVHSRLKPRCRDEHEVDDLVQETLLRAARYRSSLSDPAKLRSWLLRIARNVHRDHVRRESRYRTTDTGEELFGGLEGREDAPGEGRDGALFLMDRRELEPDAARRHVEGALSTLRCEDRVLLESYYHRGEGMAGAARRIDVPRHRVKLRLFRARNRLRLAVDRSVARERTAWLLSREVRA